MDGRRGVKRRVQNTMELAGGGELDEWRLADEMAGEKNCAATLLQDVEAALVFVVRGNELEVAQQVAGLGKVGDEWALNIAGVGVEVSGDEDSQAGQNVHGIQGRIAAVAIGLDSKSAALLEGGVESAVCVDAGDIKASRAVDSVEVPNDDNFAVALHREVCDLMPVGESGGSDGGKSFVERSIAVDAEKDRAFFGRDVDFVVPQSEEVRGDTWPVEAEGGVGGAILVQTDEAGDFFAVDVGEAAGDEDFLVGQHFEIGDTAIELGTERQV